MKPAIIFGVGLALVMGTASTADAWRAAVGPRGGAAVAGPRGAAVRGPGGGAAAVGYGGAAVRGPGGNVAVSRNYNGGAYYGGRWGYGAGAVAAGVAVGAAAGAAATAPYYYNYSCYPYYCPPPY
jgi:hypothetical protein